MGLRYLRKYVKVKRKHKFRLPTIKPSVRLGWYKLKQRLLILDSIPKPIIILMFLIFMSILFMVNNQILTKKWENDVVAMFPLLTEATIDAEGKVHTSPIETVLFEFISRNQAMFLMGIFILINISLGDIWLSYNVRKPQSFHLKK